MRIRTASRKTELGICCWLHGSRTSLGLPPPDLSAGLTVRDVLGPKNGFPEIAAGHRDATPSMHTASALTPINLERLKVTPLDGGSRLSWADDPSLQLEAYKNRRGFTDIYGRMAWDRPAPTITTKFHSLSNGRFGHPSELRAISLREGAVLQGFPKEYAFTSRNQRGIAKQIGNAVPPGLGKHVGSFLLELQAENRKLTKVRYGTVPYHLQGDPNPMSREKATYEAVKMAYIDLLGGSNKALAATDKAKSPTIDAIRDQIGGGSRNTIIARLDQVRRELAGEQIDTEDPGLGHLRGMIDPFLRAIWQSAQQQAALEHERRLKVVLDVQADMLREIKQLRDREDDLLQRLQSSEARADAEKQSVARLDDIYEMMEQILPAIESKSPPARSAKDGGPQADVRRVISVLAKSQLPLTAAALDEGLAELGLSAQACHKARHRALHSPFVGFVLTDAGEAVRRAEDIAL